MEDQKAAKKSFSALRSKMSPESRARAVAKMDELREQMNLGEIRRARQLSQASLAQTLHVTQGSVAKMERRADMYINTVRRFVEAMGGELELVAKFPDSSIKINQFADLESEKAPAHA